MKFVINLPERIDRRKEMEKELARVGWEAIFLPGIKPPDAGTFPSIGARGCFLSHLEVLERAQRLNVRELFLLEDDLNFDRNFAQRWNQVKSELDRRDWSIFYPAPGIPTPDGLVEIEASTNLVCAHFVVIHRNAIPIVVNGLHEILSRRPMHVDGAYNTIRAEDRSIKTICHWPPLGYQRSSRSDITPGRVDSLGVAKHALSLARRIKNKFRSARRQTAR